MSWLRERPRLEALVYLFAVPAAIVAIAVLAVLDHVNRVAHEQQQLRTIQQQALDNCARALAIADFIHTVVIRARDPNDPREQPLRDLERRLGEIGGCRPTKGASS